ncbi:MAG: response regulator transcription factor [Clostridia bacterium]|nr:response regulator transcription factor [Clostridia bacterium]
MTNILIVEDDINIAKTIKATLSMAGYNSEICDNGLSAVGVIKDGNWDLVLLDVMLPGLNGFDVIKKINGCNIPIIFLTALQDVLDKVNGLKLGAEDYIVKPFEALELLARIEVVLRRANKLSPILHYGDIIADITRHSIKKNGKEIPLTPREFELFVYFLKNINIAIPRDRLLSSVWGINFEGQSRTLDIHIQQIRKKLALHTKLVTIPKLGYRLDGWEE